MQRKLRCHMLVYVYRPMGMHRCVVVCMPVVVRVAMPMAVDDVVVADDLDGTCCAVVLLWLIFFFTHH